MARQMEADTAWLVLDHRYRNVLMHPQVIGFKKHPVMHQEWMYFDLDPSLGASGK
jgi:oligopeptide transport system substrate-binding protein